MAMASWGFWLSPNSRVKHFCCATQELQTFFYIHSSIYLAYCLSIRVAGEAGSNPSWLRAKGGVYPGQVNPLKGTFLHEYWICGLCFGFEFKLYFCERLGFPEHFQSFLVFPNFLGTLTQMDMRHFLRLQTFWFLFVFYHHTSKNLFWINASAWIFMLVFMTSFPQSES